MSHSKLITDSEDDIQRRAQGMIGAFERRAAEECQVRIQKMAKKGDAAGLSVWTRILLAVRRAQGHAASPVQKFADDYSQGAEPAHAHAFPVTSENRAGLQSRD